MGVTLKYQRDLSISGDVVGRDKIVNNIRQIYERALSAVEEAEQEKSSEAKILAQGVSVFAERLQARASETEAEGSGGPYKGLLEYRLSDAEIFFGRSQAIAELLENLENGPLTILHAESGAGKTSLLQAGIAPRLIAAGHLPVYLRPYNVEPSLALKRAFISDPSQTPILATAPLRDFLRQVVGLLNHSTDRPSTKPRAPSTAARGPSTAPRLKARGSAQGASRSAPPAGETTLYIFLDQFEEFFTQVEEPARVEFIRELAECLDDESLRVHWVLALRTEYFGNLANFRPRIRNPFENDYRLNRLTRAEAEEVVAQPAAERGLSYEAGLIDTLLDDLGKKEVAPPQVQLVCSALYDELKPGETTITRALYEAEGRAAGILRGHLERVLSRDLPTAERTAARRLLESLISSEQQRLVRTHTELVADLSARGVTPQTLDTIINQLIDSRLIRAQESQGSGELTYELAHDYLLGEIKLDPETQARKAAQELLEQEVRAYRRFKTLLTPERLAVIQPYRADLRFTPEAEALFTESQATIQKERAARERRRNLLLAAAISVAILMALLGVFGANRADEAQRQAATAQAASTLAFAQQNTAEANAQARATAEEAALTERDKAAQEALLANSGRLAAQALTYLDRQLDLGLLLSLEAYRTQTTFEARSSLLTALQASPHLTTFLRGHTAPVLSVAFSPDGKRAASGSADGTLIVWETATRWPVDASPEAHTGPVNSLAFSPDGKWLISGGGEGNVMLWDTLNQQAVATLNTSEISSIYALAISPDGKLLAVAGREGIIALWDVSVHQLIGPLLRGHTRPVNKLAFSPDGQTLASTSGDSTIILWDVATQQPLGAPLTGHLNAAQGIAFSPDGKLLASGGGDGSLILWDLTERENPQPIGQPLYAHAGAVLSLTFGADSQTLVSSSDDGTLLLWNLSGLLTGARPTFQRLTGYNRSVNSVAFNPESETLASGHSDGVVVLWNLNRQQSLSQPLSGHSQTVRSLAFSPASLSEGETLLASGGEDGHIILWDAKTAKNGDTAPLAVSGSPLAAGGAVLSLAFNSEGTVLASGDSSGTINLWDVATREPIGEPLTGHTQGVLSLAFSLDGKLLASGGCGQVNAEGRCDQGEVRLWNVTTPKTAQPLTNGVVRLQNGSVNSVAFSPDGKWLVSAGSDDTLAIWEMNTLSNTVAAPDIVNDIKAGGFFSLAFSPDGEKLLIGTGNGSLILWDVLSRRTIGTPLIGHTRIVTSVAFSADGKTLASGSADGAVRLWDAEALQSLGQPLTGYGLPYSLAFSPDNNWLASGGRDGNLILWDVSLETWQTRACQIAARNFTLAEWSQYFSEQAYRKTCAAWPSGK
jgi:WD40 repeat protein